MSERAKNQRSRAFRFGIACAATSAACLGLVGPASASDPAFSVDFPAGLACAFGLHVDVYGHVKDPRTLPAKDGAVRTLQAGKGYDLTFKNMSTDATYTTKGNGAVSRTTTFTDLTQKLELTGHNVVFLFPSDNPPGPSTVLYTGRVVIKVDANGVYTVKQVSGRTIDICSALS